MLAIAVTGHASTGVAARSCGHVHFTILPAGSGGVQITGTTRIGCRHARAVMSVCGHHFRVSGWHATGNYVHFTLVHKGQRIRVTSVAGGLARCIQYLAPS